MLLEANQTITLIHCTKTRDGETYSCTTVRGVSWYGRDEMAIQSDGLHAALAVIVRIPDGATAAVPQVGDFVTRGEVSGVTRQADLVNYCRVLTVGDNRRGGLPHWKLVCS